MINPATQRTLNETVRNVIYRAAALHHAGGTAQAAGVLALCETLSDLIGHTPLEHLHAVAKLNPFQTNSAINVGLYMAILRGDHWAHFGGDTNEQ